MSIGFQVLKQRLASLEGLLEYTDLIKLSEELLRHLIISKEFCYKFSSLDHDHLESDIKVRYLLKQVCERVGEDGEVLDRLVSVLGKLGGKVRSECEAMKKELGKMEGNEVLSGTQGTYLVEQDVPDLVECLVSGSHLWDAIGIALNLPKHKREDCGEGKENVNRLSNILTAWILGGYEGARPATLSSLRRALASEIVGLGKLAQELLTYRGFVDPLPVTESACSNITITYQSCDTKVAQGKSTILEVKVSCNGSESYQWSKDGEPLLDGADFCGVCSNILYINRASQCTEGKYSCRVSRGSETKCSGKINLLVLKLSPREVNLSVLIDSLLKSDIISTEIWDKLLYLDPDHVILETWLKFLTQQVFMQTREFSQVRDKLETLLNTHEGSVKDICGLIHKEIERHIVSKNDSLPKSGLYQGLSVSNAYHSEVADGKSTLLEVQVSCSGCESYQWSKDGEPLLDGADFCGVCSNILYIYRASQCTEGKYSCRVSRGSETECSDEISLSVIYPPEKKELLEFYSLTEKEVAQNSWPPINTPKHINVVLIKQELNSLCDYYTVRGDMDDILENKEVAQFEEFFKEYREGALVLVEGRPGSGKTTLVHRLTRSWATGKKILQGAKMVFRVSLRILNVSGGDKSLLELLRGFYGKVLSKTVEKSLLKYKGKGACFILDGLDEYPIEFKKNLVISQLLYTENFLPHSMVIVASRPVATKALRTICKTRMEVVGFSKDQIYSYVKSYPFVNSSPDMACKMIEYLDQHPNVLHMCYLPVHASMICFLFSQHEGEIPHRETQIYEQFTIATLIYHKARIGDKLQLKSLKFLSGEDKSKFILVCKLAFDMIINCQQVVSKSDAEVSLSVDSVLGLLTVERTSKYYGTEDLYTFSHLTFQEFLAALYMHETHAATEKLVLKDSLKNISRFYSGLIKTEVHSEFVKKIFTTLHFDFLYKVRCAYESQRVELCNHVLDNEEVLLHEDVITSTDFIAFGDVISKATKRLKKISLEHCEFDFEGMKLFVSMATEGKLKSIRSLKFVISKDEEFKAMNYLLIHLPLLEELDMFGVFLKKPKILHLTNEVKLTHLNILKISVPLLSCSNPENILKLLMFDSKNIDQVYFSVHHSHNVNCVIWKKILHHAFSCQIIQNEPKSWLHLYNLQNSPSLPCERLSHCTEVVLVNCCIGDEGAQILASTLNTSVLENLVLDFNRISDSGAIALAGCLSKCSVVQEVSIECNSIGDSGATALADALVHCNSLRRLDLQGNSLGDQGAVAIAEFTKSLSSLNLYLHNVSITEAGIKRVLQLRASTRIRRMVFTSTWNSVLEADTDTLKRAVYCENLPMLTLSLYNIHNVEKLVAEHRYVRNVIAIECRFQGINDENLPAVFNIINGLPTLHFITCDHITSSSALLLGGSLKNCKSLHSLKIRGSHSSSASQSSLLNAVKYYTKLRFLDLSNIPIGSFGVLLNSYSESWINLHTLKLRECSISAQVISEMLKLCKELCCLDLSNNAIDDDGAKAIAEGLKNHTDLLELNMTNNNITSDGMTALNQVISCNRLQHLRLSCVKFNEKCVYDLVDCMSKDSLQTLQLDSIEVGTHWVIGLTTGFMKSTQLVNLDISNSGIGTTGVDHLEKGLKQCTNLEGLILNSNNISHDGVPALCKIMETCKCLRTLDLHSNNIGIDGASDLVSGWRQNSVLVLDLHHCFNDPHKSSLLSGEKCCSRCDHLLELYYNNEYIQIKFFTRGLPRIIWEKVAVPPEIEIHGCCTLF